MKEGMKQVDKKMFNLFRGWARHNIDGFYSESAMVASRVNYFNGEGLLIAYVVLEFGEQYYIRKDVFK